MTSKTGGGSYLLVAATMMKPSEEDKKQIIDECSSTDILENTLREQMPDILDILLKDQTTSTPVSYTHLTLPTTPYV